MGRAGDLGKVFVCLTLQLLYAPRTAFPLSSEPQPFELLMPKVTVPREDAYLATFAKLPVDGAYILAIEPLASSQFVHHMLLFGCHSPNPTVADGKSDARMHGMCGYGEEKLLYGWAMDAPELRFPEASGLAIGETSEIYYAVLQVHYRVVPPREDSSGVRLHISTRGSDLKHYAGLFSFFSSFTIPPGLQHEVHTGAAHTDEMCNLYFMFFAPAPLSLECDDAQFRSLIGAEVGDPHHVLPGIPTMAMSPSSDGDQSPPSLPPGNQIASIGQGNGFGQGLFYMPHGLTVDSRGDIWVTDCGLHQVIKLTQTGEVTLSATSSSSATLATEKKKTAQKAAKRAADLTTLRSEVKAESESELCEKFDGLMKANEQKYEQELEMKNRQMREVTAHEQETDHAHTWEEVLKACGSGRLKRARVGGAVGERLQPGKGSSNFCMPTHVAVTADGAFFVADGYCNSRIVHFSASGEFLKELGGGGEVTSGMSVPHSVVLSECERRMYVADRENARILVLEEHAEGASVLADFSAEGGLVYALALRGPALLALVWPRDVDGAATPWLAEFPADTDLTALPPNQSIEVKMTELDNKIALINDTSEIACDVMEKLDRRVPLCATQDRNDRP
eukprot:gene6264-7512_t